MKKKIKENLPIAFILLVSAFLYIWRIWGSGFANSYYAAGVYSMGQSLHAFFFNSLDSVGFVTIDKPPLGFWIQTLFTKVFGFSGAVLVLPEAIAGVLSVFFIYKILHKRYGKAAGLIAASILALTPIFAAVSRNNTIDGLLILLLVLASEQALIAAEKGSMKHLIFAGVLIGLGFNVKMLQAYMIVPAVYLIYLIFAKQKFIKKILACAVSVVVMLAISLLWIVTVDLTDDDRRPYVGSSDTNSAVELAIGYNGLNRMLGRNNKLGINDTPPDDGQRVPPGDDRRVPPDDTQGAYSGNRSLPQRPSRNARQNANLPTQNTRGPAGEAGNTSIVRLFNEKNAGQIAWFMLPALASAIYALVLVFKKKHRDDKKFITYFFFAVAFLPMYIYFSFAQGITHRYYFAMMAPPIAALIGIGTYYIKDVKHKIIIPIVFAICAAAQIYVHSLYGGWLDWLTYVMAVVFATSLIAMLVMIAKKVKAKTIMLVMCVLLIMPAVWAATPVYYSDNSQLPIAGPELIDQRDSFDDRRDLSGLVDFLEENRDGSAYIAATESSMQFGAELILQSDGSVMVLGGFNGGDQVLTLDEFIAEVESGTVRYAVLLDNDKQSGNRKITSWIRENGTVVPPRQYGSLRSMYVLYRLG